MLCFLAWTRTSSVELDDAHRPGTLFRHRARYMRRKSLNRSGTTSAGFGVFTVGFGFAIKRSLRQ